MSKSEIRTPYLDAMKIAIDFLKRIESGCIRQAIAGSLRRKKSDVGDIEIVVIPRYAPEPLGMFTDVDFPDEPAPKISVLDSVLADVYEFGNYRLATVTDKNGRQHKLNGEMLKKLEHVASGVCIDLFITTPEKWGAIYTIRTGPDHFSHWLVTPRKYGGAMPSNMKEKEGLLYRGDEVIPTPEEVDFFAALNQPWLMPELRGVKA